MTWSREVSFANSSTAEAKTLPQERCPVDKWTLWTIAGRVKRTGRSLIYRLRRNITYPRHPVVRGKFYRTGFKEPQQHELAYVRNTHPEIWDLVRRYRESPVGGPLIDCPELGISVNSLGMLYYFARITKQLDKEHLDSIIEFGGGYGCLYQVLLELVPKHPTYVIIDLPEMLALQYVFLRGSSNTYRVIAHTCLPIDLKEGFVNLVPVRLIEAVDLLYGHCPHSQDQ